MDIISRATLWRLYVEEGQTIQQLAHIFQKSPKHITQVLIAHDIPRRKRGPRTQTDQSTLQHLYVEEQKTIREIAAELGMSSSTIGEMLKRCGIDRRKAARRRDRSPLGEQEAREVRRQVAARGVPGAAQYYRVSPCIIYAWLGFLPPHRGTKLKVDDHMVREVYEAGIACGTAAGTIVAALAEQFDCRERTIWRSLQRTSVRPLPGENESWTD